MCTAISLKTKNFYFGRTLDYDFSYEEEVVITPRNYALDMRGAGTLKNHYAIIGMAYVQGGFPLYYDAMNEKGLCLAGLNFVGNARYNKPRKDATNVPQFAFIPFVLSRCASVDEALKLTKKINLTDEAFSDGLPPAQLHWLIADKERTAVIEFVEEGLKVYDNQIGVLTNNPPFDMQAFALNDYLSLSPKEPVNDFAANLDLKSYSRGMGAIGLPGDLSSRSRFIRAAFFRNNSVCGDGEEESVNQFFHILGAVEQTRGACAVGNAYEITVYTSCLSAATGVYYYTTYDNHAITAVDMHAENLDGDNLYRYPVRTKESIEFVNRK